MALWITAGKFTVKRTAGGRKSHWLLHCALSLATQCIVIGPVCGRVCNGRRAGERAGGARTLLQPARTQCLRLCGRFFHWNLFLSLNLISHFCTWVITVWIWNWRLFYVLPSPEEYDRLSATSVHPELKHRIYAHIDQGTFNSFHGAFWTCPIKVFYTLLVYLEQWCGLRPLVLGQDWS